MNVGGIIAGAMGSGAQAVQGMAQGHIDDERKANLAQIENDIAMSRAKALEAYRAQAADAARTKRAGEINDRSTGIINGAREAAVTGAGMSEARRDAAVAKPVSAVDRSSARQQAAEELGYIDPKDEAMIGAKASALEAQNARLRDTLEARRLEGTANREVRVSEGEANRASREKEGEANRSSRESIAEKRLAEAMKTAEGKTTKDRATTIINSANATIKQMEEGMKPKDPAKRAEWQAELDGYYDLRRKAAESLRQKDDEPAAPAPKTAPKPAAAPAAKAGGMPAPKSRAEYDQLPSGTRYQAPDGSYRTKP